MPRTIVDLRPPQLDLHGIAGREFALDIPVTGGVLTSPVLTMKTAAGDAYTTDPGVGTATMPSADTLRVAWTAADMSALRDGGAGRDSERCAATGPTPATEADPHLNLRP